MNREREILKRRRHFDGKSGFACEFSDMGPHGVHANDCFVFINHDERGSGRVSKGSGPSRCSVRKPMGGAAKF